MSTTPAGWYQDPEAGPGDLRYWDGSQWTEHRQPAATPTSPPPPPPPPAPTPPSGVVGPPADVPGAALPPPPVTPMPAAPAMPPPAVAPIAAGSAPAAAPGAPPAPAAKKHTGLVIAIVAIVLVLVVGGVFGAVALFGGGSSKKSPEAWASSFCKKLEGDAVALKKQSDAIDGEDLDAVAAFLDDTATFLSKMSTAVADIGAPSTDGGQQMVDQLTTNLDSSAKKVRAIAKDLADGDTSSMNDLEDLEPAGNLGPRAEAAWNQISDAMKSSSSCATLQDVFN